MQSSKRAQMHKQCSNCEQLERWMTEIRKQNDILNVKKISQTKKNIQRIWSIARNTGKKKKKKLNKKWKPKRRNSMNGKKYHMQMIVYVFVRAQLHRNSPCNRVNFRSRLRSTEKFHYVVNSTMIFCIDVVIVVVFIHCVEYIVCIGRYIDWLL